MFLERDTQCFKTSVMKSEENSMMSKRELGRGGPRTSEVACKCCVCSFASFLNKIYISSDFQRGNNSKCLRITKSERVPFPLNCKRRLEFERAEMAVSATEKA